MPSSVPIFPLRLDADLRAAAEVSAKRMGLSLNAYIGHAVEAMNRVLPPRNLPKGARYLGRAIDVVAREEAAAESFQARNAPCRCGSGKKYKRCCGRSG
jgi:uncharacterized protein YecA (UPF0149 family)